MTEGGNKNLIADAFSRLLRHHDCWWWRWGTSGSMRARFQ